MPDEKAELLTRNLMDVFNEHNASQRRAAMQEIFADGATFFERDQRFQGSEAISDRITALLSSFPPKSVFKPIGRATRNHDVAKLAWTLGFENDQPAVTGMDVAILKRGKIASLYVFIDV